MTGFGSGRAVVGDEEITVELKSVNHKFCEVKARLPRELSSLEPLVVKAVKDRLARGAIDVTIKRAGASATGNVPQVDLALVKEYRRALSQLAAAAGVEDTPRLADFMVLSGVIRLDEKTADLAVAEQALKVALDAAIAALQAMRADEGRAMAQDLESRVALVERTAKEVADLSPKTVADYRARLEERIAELSRGLTVDAQRLAQEVAYFAERTDIAEEMTRLASHVDQFRKLIRSNEPAGRKLDFLVQEMHREVNTTGSKSQSTEISNRVVALKAEVERLREQVQNVE